MKWLYQLLRRTRRRFHMPPDELRLLREIRNALRDREMAYHHMDQVVDHDEVDYAIYALEAAEKKYEMLLRQAKRSNLSIYDAETGIVAEEAR